MRRSAALALAAMLLISCSGARPAQLPRFTLVNQSGETVRAEDLRGRALVVSFIFTVCVEACPILTSQIARLQARVRDEGLGGRVRFVSITVDPTTDRPDVLARYAQRYQADLSSWHFLTGTPDEIRGVTTPLGIGTAPGKRGLAHDTPILFVDPAGQVVERHDDLELDPARAVATLRRLVG
jgi:protein SCO1/2